MKKTLLAAMAATMVLSSSLTAFAAPETMPDGTIFDAEYYAQTNPDVVAILGTDKNALYQHYLNFGKAEGRRACAQSQNTGDAEGSVLIEPGDENYWRAGYLSVGFNYKLNQGEKEWNWLSDEPAYGYTRQDMRNDPYYQAMRQEILNTLASVEDKNRIRQYSDYTYIYESEEAEHQRRQARFNLAIDLVKEGIVEHCYLMMNPAKGYWVGDFPGNEVVTIYYLNYDSAGTDVFVEHPEVIGYY